MKTLKQTPGQKKYQKLFELSKHAQILQGVSSVLAWDQETYMPQGANAIRALQIETMAGIIHKERTSPAYKKALSALVDIETGQLLVKDLTPTESAAVSEWRRDYIHQASLPAAFVQEFAKVSSQAIEAWRSAKSEDCFMRFAPFLERIVTLNREKAELLGYKEHPYDALLDEYEPGFKTSQVETLFSALKDTLSPFIQTIAKTNVPCDFLNGNWDKDKQLQFSHQLLQAIGYDENNGRLDFSSHPFSTSFHPTDCRITSRIHPQLLMSNILAVLHEAGHAFYELGLPAEHYGSPLAEARSLGVHESQSRFWETRIGLSQPFWKHFYPALQTLFPKELGSVDQAVFYKAINKVSPSFIRIEADELTYPLHIILRFELEKALIEGSLLVRDLPDAWNAKMQHYLGITPKTNREGCLQDIHWSMGAFGYFPTYTLGNLYAAHLFNGFAFDHSDWETKVEQGEFQFIKSWMQNKIHRHGRSFSVHDLLQQATGQPFSARAYLDYLKQKYQRLFT